MSEEQQPASTPPTHRRRPRYSGRNPRRFAEKYKERDPAKYGETVAKVIASGKTPAGTHRPIMVTEILEVLAPKPGEIGVDCTLGYGGHAQQMLSAIQPGGRILGLDADPIELPKAEARLRSLGFDTSSFTAYRSNFAGLAAILAEAGLNGVDFVLADLGVSSMQIDDPTRGFSVKLNGPLDMRMNPQRGQSASSFLQKVKADEFAELLVENSDEPKATELGNALAGKSFITTSELVQGIYSTLPRMNRDELDLTVRRVFQALRIAVNDEFSALETFLRQLPACLNLGGRVAILTFHSGEDRRVKKAFQAGLRDGIYQEIARDVIRPTPEERYANPRSAPAKLRWARRA